MPSMVLVIDAAAFAMACVTALFYAATAADRRRRAARKAIVYRAFAVSKRVE
jgi:hypothetical protein